MCLRQENQALCCRGFFSLFIQALRGISYALKNDLYAYVDFGSKRYPYSDSANFYGDNNFWNYYFQQPFGLNANKLKNAKLVVNQIQDNYPEKELALNPEYLREMNKIFREQVQFSENAQKIIDQIEETFVNKKIIGVHIRRTDHFTEYPPVPFETYRQLLKQEAENFDHIFLATDDQNVVNELIAEFGSKVMCLGAYRSQNQSSVHLGSNFKNKYKLGFDALLDCYCLSLCQKIIITHSNFSYAALIFNPEIPYQIF